MIRKAVFFCLAILILLAAEVQPKQCVRDAYPPKSSPPIPWFTVNLDLKPEERWKEVAQTYRGQMANLMNTLKKTMLDVTKYSQHIISFVDRFGGLVESTLPSPFAEEIRGVAFYSGLNLGEVMVYNVFYELFSVCTSIVAEDWTGNLVHARNLDFGLFLGWDSKNDTWSMTEALRPLVINVNFQRGGRSLFKAVSFAGYVGVLTAIKPNKFSLTVNERFRIDGGFVGILKWLAGDRRGGWVGFVGRSVMENSTNYHQAVKEVTTTPLLAPAYFILGAARLSRQAVVVTRSAQGPGDVWKMSTIADHPWFMVQTDYDHWSSPFFLDDRRTPANRCMLNLTRLGVGFAGLYNVLSTQPVLNKLTTYTTLMEVSTGGMESYIRHCPDPCYLW